MSEKKRKPQIIHVDRVIIKANEVIIKEDRDDHEYQTDNNRSNRRDPWGFFSSNETGGENERRKEERDNDDDNKGFSWF